jgi:hypothetical protein
MEILSNSRLLECLEGSLSTKVRPLLQVLFPPSASVLFRFQIGLPAPSEK